MYDLLYLFKYTILPFFVAQMRHFALEEDVNIEQLCMEHLPAALTGADVYDITSRAYAIALGRKLKEVDALLATTSETQFDTNGDSTEVSSSDSCSSFQERCRRVADVLATLPRRQLQATVRQSDLIDAARGFKPSVSDDELLTYERIAARLNETT